MIDTSGRFISAGHRAHDPKDSTVKNGVLGSTKERGRKQI